MFFMCNLIAQGLALLGGTSASHVPTVEDDQVLKVQDTGTHSISASWLGAEAMEILLEVFVMLAVFAMSKPLLARVRKSNSKLPEKTTYFKGRNGSGSISSSKNPQVAAMPSPEAQIRFPSASALEKSRECRLSQFLAINNIDGSERTMRELPKAVAEWVMDQEFVLKDECPSSALASRVAEAHKFPNEFWDCYPNPSGLARRLETYIDINRLDIRCAKTLERLPLDILRLVMDHEFVVQVDSKKGTSSAKVVGHIMRMCRD